MLVTKFRMDIYAYKCSNFIFTERTLNNGYEFMETIKISEKKHY